MKNYLRAIPIAHKKFWDKQKFILLLHGFGLLAIALVIQKIADVYVGKVKAVTVPDVILNHLPTVNVNFFIVQGPLIITVIIAVLLIIKPKYFSFTIKALSIFIITRSISISLTHLGVSPTELQPNTHSFGFGLYNWLFNTKGDFFFSGHTGIPYLLALIFWPEKFWRRFFIITSIIFAASVLLAKIHYSIDVFAAPFMTYGIFTIARTIFKKDYRLMVPDAPLKP